MQSETRRHVLFIRQCYPNMKQRRLARAIASGVLDGKDEQQPLSRAIIALRGVPEATIYGAIRRIDARRINTRKTRYFSS